MIAQKLLSASGGQALREKIIAECRSVSTPFFLLLLWLYLNKAVASALPELWIFVPLSLAVALSRARFSDAEKPVVRLWQLIGLLSAVYSLLHYPLMPLAQGDPSALLSYSALMLGWMVCIFGGILCFRMPCLSVLPPAFLFWGNGMAAIVTGLPVKTHIDVQPLTEVSVCIGLGLLANRIHARWERYAGDSSRRHGDGDAFPALLLLIAFSVHLANYYWAFYAKMSLDGPFGAWLAENNPAYIFLAALDDGHILFSAHRQWVRWIYSVLDELHVCSNFGVLLIQGAALFAFFMSKRFFLALLLMLDAMHVAIITIAGANFWPWIILNVVIAAVAVSPSVARQPAVFRFIATGFILIAPCFVNVTKLGWYDTGANNKIYFEALDDAGKRHVVPENFFTFYSYPLGHMDYGSPEPGDAFATEEPHGGSHEYKLFQAGRSCNAKLLTRPGASPGFDRGRLAAFVKNYHRLALMIEAKIGFFPYDIYPHHFFVPVTESADFRALDKRRVVAYIFRRESVCLSFSSGVLQRRIVSAAEYRIDVNGAAPSLSTVSFATTSKEEKRQ